MEILELQKIWQQYDARLAENTRINKEILKRMLQTKPEKRVNWLKMKEGGSLFLSPIILLLFLALSPVKFNHGLMLYLGIFLCGGCIVWGNYWTIKYFRLLSRIDFTNPVTTTRKDVTQLEKYYTQRSNIGYILMPVALTGVFLIFDMPFFTKSSILPLALIFVVMMCSMYYRFRWKNWWFKKVNTELNEIENLEKE